MTGIYLEKKDNNNVNNMEFFIGSLDEKALVEIDDIAAILESAFANSDVENIRLKGKFSSIRESAFENCDKLKTVIFEEQGEKDKQATSPLKNVKPASAADGLSPTAGGGVSTQPQVPASVTDGLGSTAGEGVNSQPQATSPLKNVVPASVTGNFTIQTNAFKGCSSLTTLVLPQISGTLTIEKDAFSGCEKLRAVVAVCGNVDFTGNPFSGCPAHLTFVCKKDSDVARFARENGYRSVYVD